MVLWITIAFEYASGGVSFFVLAIGSIEVIRTSVVGHARLCVRRIGLHVSARLSLLEYALVVVVDVLVIGCIYSIMVVFVTLVKSIF